MRITLIQNAKKAHREFVEMSRKKVFENKSLTDYLLWIFKEKDFTLNGLRNYFEQRRIQSIKQVNQFFEIDFARLGSDLHAATYTVKLGGKYKLKNSTRWIGLDSENKNLSDILPSERTATFSIDGLDFSRTVIQSDGLDNIENCPNLKILKFNECSYVDDWFLARLPNLNSSGNLEVLDVSGCDLITDSGLIMLGHLKNLKHLKLDDLKNAKNKEFISILLEETIQGLLIDGCDYLSKESLENLTNKFNLENNNLQNNKK